MKNLVLSIAVALSGLTATAQQSGATIEFESEVHDYGTVLQGESGDCVFKLTNSGSEPLIISNARGSCNCTVPSWPKDPILPGETAEIKVHYNTKRLGPINKTVTVSSNAINAPTTVLRIKGKVVAPE